MLCHGLMDPALPRGRLHIGDIFQREIFPEQFINFEIVFDDQNLGIHKTRVPPQVLLPEESPWPRRSAEGSHCTYIGLKVARPALKLRRHEIGL